MIDQGWYCHCPHNFVSSHTTCQSPLIQESLLFKLDPDITALIDESLLFKANPPQSVLPVIVSLYS